MLLRAFTSGFTFVPLLTHSFRVLSYPPQYFDVFLTNQTLKILLSMKKTILSSTLIAFLTSHIYAQFEWQITGADTIRPNEKCYLFNTKINKKVAYKSQKRGINLSWSSPQKGGSNILFQDENNEDILATNEATAIYVEIGRAHV